MVFKVASNRKAELVGTHAYTHTPVNIANPMTSNFYTDGRMPTHVCQKAIGPGTNSWLGICFVRLSRMPPQPTHINQFWCFEEICSPCFMCTTSDCWINHVHFYLQVSTSLNSKTDRRMPCLHRSHPRALLRQTDLRVCGPKAELVCSWNRVV